MNTKNYEMPNCLCGSGLRRRSVYDARDIFLCYVCDKCERKELGRYRPEVLTDPNYETCEDIDNEG